MFGQCVDQRADCGGIGLDIHPQAEFGGGLGGFGADAGDNGPRVRLTGDADQVPHRGARGEAHRVKAARLDHFAGGRRRRCRAHGPVGGDVLDLPATLAQSLGQRFGRDVGARQQDTVDRVENAVIGREVVQQTQRGLLPARHQLRADPESTDPVGSRFADAGDLHPGERTGVQTELTKLLPHRTHRVGGGEHHPLETAIDQTLDGTFHLSGAPRRLDGYGRHLDRKRAVTRQPLAHFAGLVFGARHQDRPAVQFAALPPVQLRPAGHDLSDGDHQRSSQRTRRVGDAEGGRVGQSVQRGFDRTLLAGGAVRGHHARRGVGQLVLDQGAGRIGQMRCSGLQDQRPGSRRQCIPVGAYGVDAHIGNRVRRAQRQPGVARDGAGSGQAGDDLDVQVAACDGVHLGDHRVDRQRVTGHQPHHVGARTSLGGQHLGDFGGIAHRWADVGAAGHDRGRGLALIPVGRPFGIR